MKGQGDKYGTVAASLRRIGLAIVLALVALAGPPTWASTVDCEAIAAKTGARHGVPRDLMPAISRVETGLKQGDKGVRAWPWTLNVQGKGYYFPTRAAALKKLREVLDSGVRNVDVGCMQINYRWHSEKFASIEEMMSPEANTEYAARFLAQLKDRHGSWEKATQNYHSADGDRGEAYLGRVNRVIAKLPQQQPSFVASTAGRLLQPDGQAVARQPRRQALVTARHGVLALASTPLIDVAGMGGQGGSVVLPESPLPKLAAVRQPCQAALPRRSGRATADRGDLIAQLRAEFAN